MTRELSLYSVVPRYPTVTNITLINYRNPTNSADPLSSQTKEDDLSTPTL